MSLYYRPRVLSVMAAEAVKEDSSSDDDDSDSDAELDDAALRQRQQLLVLAKQQAQAASLEFQAEKTAQPVLESRVLDEDSDSETSSSSESDGGKITHKPVYVPKGMRKTDQQREHAEKERQEAEQRDRILKREKKEKARDAVAASVMVVD